MTYKAHKRTSLKLKSSDELILLRIDLMKDFSTAKKMLTYGAMGHIAEKIAQISLLLSHRGTPVIAHQKPSLVLVKSSCTEAIYPQKMASY